MNYADSFRKAQANYDAMEPPNAAGQPRASGASAGAALLGEDGE